MHLIDEKCRNMIRAGEDEKLSNFMAREEVQKWIRLGGLDRQGILCERKNIAQKTLLHNACAKGQVRCVQILLEAKASPNVKAQGLPKMVSGEISLHVAVMHNQTECVKLLLEAKARQDEQDSSGKTALHIAAGSENGSLLVRLLLREGADITIEDCQKRTALKYAKEKKRSLAVKEFEAEIKSRNMLLELQSSPYAPFKEEQILGNSSSSSADTAGLPKPVFTQLMLMVQNQTIRKKDLDDFVPLLRALGPTRSILRLQAYETSVASGSQYRPLAQTFLSGTNARYEGIWQGLQDGKPFGFIKMCSEEIFAHRRQVRDVDNLQNGQSVYFEIGYSKDGRRQEAQNVNAAEQSGETSIDITWVTNGSLNPPVSPCFLMLTREESMVMLDFGAQIQFHESTIQPFVDKHFRILIPDKGLPAATQLFAQEAYQKSSVSEIEAKLLGSIKSLLDEKDIKVWKQHTAKTLITGDVVKSLRKERDPEMCTKAFAKMYEMLSAYDLVAPNGSDQYSSLHLCEAPGAFICATNHYIKSRFPNLKWTWRACSLNPYFEGNNTDAMVDDDKFINETTHNWYFGCDDTGDMRLRENIEGAIAEAKGLDGPLLLVTADGSVDCSDVPNEQEEHTAQLHYCETVAALGALESGGCFVLKMFMLFEHSSIGLLYLLGCLFQDVSVCKPVMSTPGNSETYIISRGFLGISREYFDVLLQNTGIEWPVNERGQKLALIPQDWMVPEWTDKMIECGKFFSRLQGSVIKRNLRLFDELTRDEGQAIVAARDMVSREWMRRYQIQRIDRSRRIVSTTILHGNSNRLGAKGRERDGGSLAERIDLKNKRKRIREGDQHDPVPDPDPSRNDSEGTKGMKLGHENSQGMMLETSEPIISEFAKKHMEKMGHKSGSGLGKSGQGIQKAIQAIVKLDFRAGISYCGESETITTSIAIMEPADMLWIDNRLISMIIGDAIIHDRQSIKEGKRLTEFQMSKFCAQNIILELLEMRDKLNRVLLRKIGDADDVVMSKEPSSATHTSSTILRCKGKKEIFKKMFDCYQVGSAGFISRAAIKMADLNRLCCDMFANIKEEKVSFIDLYGGRGGFSDYALWKLGEKIDKGWIVDRKHKASPEPKGFKSASQYQDPKKFPLEVYRLEQVGCPISAGFQVDCSILAELEPIIELTRDSKIVCVFGDGTLSLVSSAAAHIRSIESLSTKTLLCQCVVALESLADGGLFICKISDSLGRCTAGAVLVLASLFEKLTCIKPEMSCPVKSERFLVCIGFLGKSKAAGSALHLREVISRMDMLNQDDSKDILAFVPQRLLMAEAFSSCLIKMNERDCKQEATSTKYIIPLLKRTKTNDAAKVDVEELFRRLGLIVLRQ